MQSYRYRDWCTAKYKVKYIARCKAIDIEL